MGMSLAYANEAIYLREGGLSDRDIARATGVGLSTVGSWLRRTRAPKGQRAERLVELAAIVERATRVMEPDYVVVWLHRPVPALDDDKPIDVIARGEYKRVAQLLSALESPTAI
jgi:putative toxin-antitoxin system antitoxin component (TIGR02293 family)